MHEVHESTAPSCATEVTQKGDFGEKEKRGEERGKGAVTNVKGQENQRREGKEGGEEEEGGKGGKRRSLRQEEGGEGENGSEICNLHNAKELLLMRGPTLPSSSGHQHFRIGKPISIDHPPITQKR